MRMPAHRAALTRTDYRILGRMTFRWRFSPRTNSGEELFCLVVPQAVREFSCREDYSTDYWLCCAPRMINYWRWSYARGAVLCIVCADDVSWTVGEPTIIITTITDTAHHNLKLWFHQISNYCPFVFVFLFVCCMLNLVSRNLAILLSSAYTAAVCSSLNPFISWEDLISPVITFRFLPSDDFAGVQAPMCECLPCLSFRLSPTCRAVVSQQAKSNSC